MKKLIVLSVAVLIVLSGCFSTPAREVTNICNLLDEKVSWYRAAKDSEEKWKVPMHLQLAIIHQESRFASKAKPCLLYTSPSPRDGLLSRMPSSA